MLWVGSTLSWIHAASASWTHPEQLRVRFLLLGETIILTRVAINTPIAPLPWVILATSDLCEALVERQIVPYGVLKCNRRKLSQLSGLQSFDVYNLEQRMLDLSFTQWWHWRLPSSEMWWYVSVGRNCAGIHSLIAKKLPVLTPWKQLSLERF
jgi:hypothetical protein